MNLLVLLIILVIKFKWNDIMVDFVVTGFNEAASFGTFNMSKAGKIDAMKIGPDDKYSSMEFTINNRFQIKEIPGKNNKDITMRTSDKHTSSTGTLFSFSITQNTVTLTFWDKILQMVRLGGPYKVSWIWPETTDMCILKGSFKQSEGQAEYPDKIYLDNGSEVQAMVGVWTIEFSEYNKGTPGNAGGSATAPITVIPPLVIVPTKSEPDAYHWEKKIGGLKLTQAQYIALAANDKYDEGSGDSNYWLVPGPI